MTQPDQEETELARRLLFLESGGDRSARQVAAAAGRIHGALFRSIAPVLGASGVHALFTRSLKLTRASHPCLEDVVVVASSPEGHARVADALVNGLSRLEPAEGWEVATSLYATLFGIMTRLIGKSLVRQLLKRAFPAIEQTGPQEKT